MTDQPRWIEYIPVDDLPDAPTNAKGHAEELIESSIARFRFSGSPAIDERTGRLIGGHGRRDALRKLRDAGHDAPEGIVVTETGTWLVPVERGWSSVDDDEAEAFGLALNRTSEVGGWQDQQLADSLTKLAALPDGLAGVGFDRDYLKDLLDRLNKKDPWNDRDFRPLPDARGLTDGEVWDVGPHRLVIGDARNDECWSVLPQCQLVVMDPPYGIDYGGGGGLEREAIDGDSSPEEAIELLSAIAGKVVEHAEPGAACYTFLACDCDGDCFPPMLQALATVGLARWHLVWIKNNATFGRADYQFQHENVAYGWTKANARLRPVANRKLTSVWRVDRPSRSEDHPTAKPVEVLTIPIEASSLPGDVVCDPFAGSGSTLVAAARAGRIGCGIELRPEYARVTLDRLAAETGHEPKRANA